MDVVEGGVLGPTLQTGEEIRPAHGIETAEQEEAHMRQGHLQHPSSTYSLSPIHEPNSEVGEIGFDPLASSLGSQMALIPRSETIKRCLLWK